MTDVLNLALPYFGLIFLGYACGRFRPMPESGLAWMNFFLIYVALPCLFYRIVATTPFEELNNVSFILGTTLATGSAYALAFAAGMVMMRGEKAPAAMAGLAGAYGNVGYMGPGLALAALGPQATAPVALIFCFDNILVFSLAPFLMALAGTEHKTFGAIARDVTMRIALHPFIIATALGVLSAAAHFQPPVALDRLMAFLQNGAAPCALFVMGVTVALRPLRSVPWEVPVVLLVKLAVHPLMALALLSLLGPFSQTWIHAAVLMAALPPALNAFIIARQYDTWVEQASGSVLLGTLVSVVSLTAVMWLVKTGMLPTKLF
ncbi:MAG TPA: AEC family transporter [Pseudorhodoplanes sp.]|nr:AEC family transporter [Pseudorhodoplanes sp.]